MAGFVTRDLEVAGYTASKTGVIALTRSFETSTPNIYSTEGIKCYAICPYFANTQLVTDRIAIADLEKQFKNRVLTVSEVGNGFQQSLNIDQNGGCVVVYPDCPPFLVPNIVNKATLMTMIAFGQYFGASMSFTSFNGRNVLIGGFLLLLVLIYMTLSIIF